jgi:hypothetical protein
MAWPIAGTMSDVRLSIRHPAKSSGHPIQGTLDTAFNATVGLRANECAEGRATELYYPEYCPRQKFADIAFRFCYDMFGWGCYYPHVKG